MTDRIYTTTRGKTVEFVPIPALLDALKASYPYPKKPQYAMVSKLTGVTEYADHDETTVNTPEEKAAWQEYIAALNTRNVEYSQALLKTVLLFGIKYDEPTNDEWAKAQSFAGIKVPTEPNERKLHYITTELISTHDPLESEKVILGVFAASGVSEEILSAMADSFRHSLGRSERRETKRVGNPGTRQGVVFQQAVRRSGRGNRKRHS